MLKFTYVVNLGLAGALIVPSVAQKIGSIEHLEGAIVNTDRAIQNMESLETNLQTGDYSSVQRVLDSTEKPFGGERERSILLDRLRDDIGQLEAQVVRLDEQAVLPHLQQDPTETLADETTGPTPTVGLSQEGRDILEDIWPPVPGIETPLVRKNGDRLKFEAEGFTVDALRQGRAYYRAKRYQEALRLIQTRKDDPEAEYWVGRCLERLDRPQEAVAAYAAVEAALMSGPLFERAKTDREFLEWLINFNRKIRDLRGEPGESK